MPSFCKGGFGRILYQVAIKHQKADLSGIMPSKLSKIHSFFESNLVLLALLKFPSIPLFKKGTLRLLIMKELNYL